jgi:hypothetical protein
MFPAANDPDYWEAKAALRNAARLHRYDSLEENFRPMARRAAVRSLPVKQESLLSSVQRRPAPYKSHELSVDAVCLARLTRPRRLGLALLSRS